MHRGFVKLYRKTNDWEWKTKPNTVALFFHLLLNANHKPKKWRGVTLTAGQLVTGRKKLSQLTGLSERQVRTALTHLKSTNEVTIQSTKEYSIISMTNWDIYQGDVRKATNDRPTTDQRPTTTKEWKEGEEGKEVVLHKKNKTKSKPNKPEEISIETWEDFLTLRKSKKAPVTDTVIKRMKTESAKAGISLEEAIQETCARGWTGFKAEWYENTKQSNGKQHNGKQSQSERFSDQAKQLLDRVRDGEFNQSNDGLL